ncbi:MAG: FtsX-like permease family protein [Thermoleophilia bacterium]|nr:FtsX-like permease family protein [Thermoleophilia bacterium]
MIRFSLKGMMGRKLRTALTALAVILGVTMVSGTFVLTDSIDKAFDAIFSSVYEGTDATITGRSAFDLSDGSGTTAPPFDESLQPEVAALPDVAAAIGGVAGEAQLVGKNGKAIVFGGAPNLGFSVDPTKPEFNTLTLEQGSWPADGEVVIDVATASKKDLSVGDQIGVQAEGPVEQFKISGLVKFGSVDTIGGATLAGFNLPTAQQLFRKVGKLDQIRVAGKPGVSSSQLVSEIEAILPEGTQVRTGAEQATEDAKGTDEFISFLRYFLLAFGVIALFVGAFVIFNSLSITIAQRTRELATLRTLGASRRQVRFSVIVESLVMGTLASIIGLFLGLALATGLFKLFDAVGFTLPNSGLIFSTRTIIVSLLLGITVTLIASILPAFKATRVPPIAAVREGATIAPGRFARFRTPIAAVITLLGFAGLLWGLFGPDLETTQILLFMILGMVLVFIGVAMLSAPLIPGLTGILGWPGARFGGAAGALARDNARRNPQRTASTAAALMIGLALVTLVATLAGSIVQTFTGAVDKVFVGNYAITAQNNFSPIPIDAAAAAAQAPGVVAVGNVRTGEALVFGSTEFATAVDPGAAKVINLDWVEGSNAVLGELGKDGAFVDEDYAKKHDLKIGSPVEITFANGTTATFTVKGIFDPPSGGSPFGVVTISAEAWDAQTSSPKNLYSFVRMDGGESEANAAALEAALKPFPNAKFATRGQFVTNQISGLKSILNVLYVLLGLSIIVSLFGIINTLVLSVFERTREIGMLRAIGMNRRQTRRMIRHESVITSMIGALIGIVLGVILAGLLIFKIDLIDFSFPTSQVIIFAIAAVLVGVVAAIFPARRAAKLNPLEALHYE